MEAQAAAMEAGGKRDHPSQVQAEYSVRPVQPLGWFAEVEGAKSLTFFLRDNRNMHANAQKHARYTQHKCYTNIHDTHPANMHDTHPAKMLHTQQTCNTLSNHANRLFEHLPLCFVAQSLRTQSVVPWQAHDSYTNNSPRRYRH